MLFGCFEFALGLSTLSSSVELLRSLEAYVAAVELSGWTRGAPQVTEISGKSPLE